MGEPAGVAGNSCAKFWPEEFPSAHLKSPLQPQLDIVYAFIFYSKSTQT